MRLALVCYYCFDIEWINDLSHQEWIVGNGRRWHTCKECKGCFERDY